MVTHNQWYYLLEVDLAVSIDLFMNSCKAFSLASISDISAEWSSRPDSNRKSITIGSRDKKNVLYREHNYALSRQRIYALSVSLSTA